MIWIMPSLLIKNGTLVLKEQTGKADILSENGRIAVIAKNITADADQVFDAHGLYVLPGIVDAHAHMDDPASPDREDFATGSCAAAAGGVTTVVNMVLRTPVDTPNAIKEKIRRGTQQAVVDFSLHAGMMNEDNVANIKAIAQLGVRSFKTFMCAPYHVEKATILNIMKNTRRYRAITNVHAEDEELSQELTQTLQKARRFDPMAHNESKPNAVEAKGVAEAIELSRAAHSRLHISHMSTKEGAILLAKAKKDGVDVSAETCPHYLTLTKIDMLKLGPYLKVNPPLRTKADSEALWRGLADGTIDMITSEHAPGTIDEKEIGWENIWDAWAGIPSIETMLPIVLSEGVNKNRITLEQLAKVMSVNPAKRFGFYPRKGNLDVGADADLTIVDLSLEKRVTASDLHYKVGWTPYEDWTLKGWPQTTIVRGRVIMQDGEITAKEGQAQFIPMKMRR